MEIQCFGLISFLLLLHKPLFLPFPEVCLKPARYEAVPLNPSNVLHPHPPSLPDRFILDYSNTEIQINEKMSTPLGVYLHHDPQNSVIFTRNLYHSHVWVWGLGQLSATQTSEICSSVYMAFFSHPVCIFSFISVHINS